MQLNDLVTGQMVILRNKTTRMVLRNTMFGDILTHTDYHNIRLDDYYVNMTSKSSEDYDICEVYNPVKYNAVHSNNQCSECATLIWRRPETKEIPMSKVMDILAKELSCSKENIKITS